ncbi:hypothetical protein [Duganella callida]|uniref:FecR protein domain-containing protein n=1 Tax=Duganella callida TaxID=2561932 RepID=A0A4Y9S5I7_9BURK|nr:hypothetical protein [Duganella callida]TFW14758.1 hypothetical protein E4L98_27480 [Duganella callida]
MERLSYLLFAAALQAVLPARAAEVATITFAEQPLRALRDTSFFTLPRGARPQNGDILETRGSGAQIEGIGATIAAVGPATVIHLKLGGVPELRLLQGWLKVQAGKSPGPAIVSGPLRLTLASGSIILHSESGKTELFVEDGEPAVTETATGKPARQIKVAREQYAIVTAAAPLKALPRPPKDFIAGLPPGFADILVSVPFKGAEPPIRKEGPATFEEAAPWLSDAPALRQLLHNRFYPPPPPKKDAPKAPVNSNIVFP